MKKERLTAILLVITMVFTLGSPSALGAAEVSVELNGEKIWFDVPPQIIHNRTMVPLRGIFEALGASVGWEASERKVIIWKDDHCITAYIDNPTIKVATTQGAKRIESDVPPMIIGNRTLVPLRVFADVLGCDVSWDAKNNIAKISTLSFEPTVGEWNLPHTYHLAKRAEVRVEILHCNTDAKTLTLRYKCWIAPTFTLNDSYGLTVDDYDYGNTIKVSYEQSADKNGDVVLSTDRFSINGTNIKATLATKKDGLLYCDYGIYNNFEQCNRAW